MSDTPERPDPASPAPAETPAPGPPAAPSGEPGRSPGGSRRATAPGSGRTRAATAPAPAATAPAPAATAPRRPPPQRPAPRTGRHCARAGSAPGSGRPRTGFQPPTRLAAPAPAPTAPAPVPAAGAGAQPGAESSFFGRVKRVFNFETGVYPEVAGNGQATLEAIVVVALATLFFGSFWSLFIFFLTVPLALALTAVSAGLVTLSARLFNQDSPGFAPWFRALAFAQAPLSLGIIPLVGSFIAMVYCIATSIAAIHRVAGLPVGLAILTWVIAWLLPVAFLLFLAFVFGGLAFVGSLMSGMA